MASSARFLFKLDKRWCVGGTIRRKEGNDRGRIKEVLAGGWCNPQRAGKLAGKCAFLTRSLMGSVGRAAVKALYARQYSTSGDHRADRMLKAALWALVDIVLKAPPRLIKRSIGTSSRPLVYADAYIKVGEE